jgi:hypothetical protein
MLKLATKSDDGLGQRTKKACRKAQIPTVTKPEAAVPF